MLKHKSVIMKCHRHRLCDVQTTTISLLFELIRDNYLVFSGDFSFSHCDFLTLINYESSV